MKYSRFEELPVWKDAIELTVRVFALTARPIFKRYRSVRDQLERASMSISNNIAEGFERGTTQETLTFYTSRVGPLQSEIISDEVDVTLPTVAE